jgi:hypothetical protein
LLSQIRPFYKILIKREMEKLIACCGLNCAGCEARIATINDNDDLRCKTAEKWMTIYNATDITPEMINCTGCREPGVKIGHYEQCEIRKCVISKSFQTCADCDIMEKCELVANIHKHAPEALDNLRSLN